MSGKDLSEMTDDELRESFDNAKPMRSEGVFKAAWRPVGDSIDIPPPDRDFILQGLLDVGRVGLLTGHGGRGKSWSLTQLAISVATGAPWFGEYVVPKPGKVLLALGEEDQIEAHRRIYEAVQALQLNDRQIEDLKKNLFAIPLGGKQVSLIDGSNASDLYLELKDLVTFEEGLRLVILDPLSRFAGDETEGEAKAATRFITLLEDLTASHAGSKFSVIMAHHERKPGGARDTGDQFSVRGSTGLVDGARWVARLGKVKDDESGELVKFEVVKTNYAPSSRSITLERRPGRSGVLFKQTELPPKRNTPGRANSSGSDLVDNADL